MFIRSKTLSLSVVSFMILLTIFAFSSSSLNFKKADATSVNSTFTAHLNEVLIMNAPGDINITNCNPSTSSLCTASADVSVVTNNLTGYSLYMNITDGSSTSLTNTLTSPSSTIPTLSQSYSSSNFPTNYWGYTGGTDQSGETGGYNCSTNYCPILAYQSNESNYSPNHIIKQTDAPAATSTTNLTFAAKADTTKASGTYSTSVTFTAVANEVPAQPIQNGMNMQDIDSATCAATPLYSVSNTTYTVVDSRDQTNYTVAKLEDGNCWMTQNLALGGSTAMNLTQADSNVGPSGFTLPASVSNSSSWTNIYPNPEFFDYAGKYPSQQATTKYGNFYNWHVAVAGSSASTDGEDAPYDICPKNWRLPSAGSSDNFSSEFYIMLNYYLDSSKQQTDGYWYGLTISQITSAPVSLLLSGYYNEGGLKSQDSLGNWWSSTRGQGGNYAYYANARNSGGLVYPRDQYSTTDGRSVRCLVSGA